MEQVFRCYVEKRPGFDVEAMGVMRELREQLGPNTAMLVKASHSMHFGALVEELRKSYD